MSKFLSSYNYLSSHVVVDHPVHLCSISVVVGANEHTRLCFCRYGGYNCGIGYERTALRLLALLARKCLVSSLASMSDLLLLLFPSPGAPAQVCNVGMHLAERSLPKQSSAVANAIPSACQTFFAPADAQRSVGSAQQAAEAVCNPSPETWHGAYEPYIYLSGVSIAIDRLLCFRLHHFGQLLRSLILLLIPYISGHPPISRQSVALPLSPTRAYIQCPSSVPIRCPVRSSLP